MHERTDIHPQDNPPNPARGIAGTRPGVTRLAPSPTGALHLGNARTFLATWAMARQRGWRIVLRVEDLDTPRVKPGVTQLTIDLLRWLGMDWDDGPFVQSEDLTPYVEAMRTLATAGLVYPTTATRTELGRLGERDEPGASAPQEGATEAHFPRSLRPSVIERALPASFAAMKSASAGAASEDALPAWRFACPDGRVEFVDAFAGRQSHEPSATVGDFIVWTRRGQPAYQLAVVVDDHRHGVTEIVRGDDLLDSAARQILLARALGFVPPAQCHVPLVRGSDGKRLAKRHGDTRLDHYRAAGVAAERVIGLVAWWGGLTPGGRRAMDISEFRARFTLDTMAKGPVVFTSEDDAWLRARR